MGVIHIRGSGTKSWAMRGLHGDSKVTKYKTLCGIWASPSQAPVSSNSCNCSKCLNIKKLRTDKTTSETKVDIIKDIKGKTKHLKPHIKGEFNKVLKRADKGELECIRKHCKTSPDGSQVYTGLFGKY